MGLLFGSVAKREGSTASDIDVILISESLNYANIFAALDPATAQLGRPVNSTVLSKEKLAKRMKAGNAFVQRELSQPNIWLVGGESDISF